MLSRYILVLLFCCVYGVVSLSPFFEKGERAEIYELMDDEMPTLRIYIPDEEFSNLKEEGLPKTVETIEPPEFSIEESLYNIVYNIKFYLKFYKSINYTEFYSGYNFNEILPQLQVGEDGYPQFDVEEVFAGYDYDPDHYKDLNITDYGTLNNKVYKSNKYFDLLEVTKKLNDLELSVATIDFTNKYKSVSIEPWELEQIHKYDKDPEDVIAATENPIIEEESVIIEEETEITEEFKIKNATMIFEINGNISSFNKVTFKKSGNLSRTFSKIMFNVKIKNGEELYGRRNFKLRPDIVDPTYLRSKLVSDIRNRIGIKSVSANYILFYINDEFMGLYIMTDVINLPWIEDVYGEKKATNLYKCNNFNDFKSELSSGCENKNEDITDDTEWINFLKTVENAKSISDIENIFDIDHFLYELAIDYLTNAYDHSFHNFYLYKQSNGKWTYLSYDFDIDFSGILDTKIAYADFIQRYSGRGRIYDILISKDPEIFSKVLKDIVSKVFNPATLYPHIDEIKQFIEPYVQLSKTPDSNGYFPGDINVMAITDMLSYSFDYWDTISEFTVSDNIGHKALGINVGLKCFILLKYRSVCHQLNMECDPVYMDENYQKETCYYDNGEGLLSVLNNDEKPTDDIYFSTLGFDEPTEKETVYEIDEPTFSTDEESSFDEEEEITLFSSYPDSATSTKTITKTQTIVYPTILN